ncbi:HCL603Wp [Eremothecium sinecaudum]|uniref:Phosphatidate cytidylyltransferase, mitochondrial n=1 Tax=Eremothecium sinecaudum TaxID=45286 RepID=A0A109UXV9_9SACH|nr:HCL603Wp [Eremothecium sinecaudum]AMD19548.1 HCL603Wp [Eremothecium sinecaudum]
MLRTNLIKLESRLACIQTLHRRLQSQLSVKVKVRSRDLSSCDNITTLKSDLNGESRIPSEEVIQLAFMQHGLKKTSKLISKFSNYRENFNKFPPNYASNQLLKIDSENEKELHEIMSHFKAPVRYAFGYGSGVFHQANYDLKVDKPQIDLIFGVNHPEHFHSLNMRQNPDHYSSMKYFGSSIVANFQEIGAGIYFNPYVNIRGHEVKYGIVSMDNLLKDLATWNTFYLAGRLQKPVKVLKNDLTVQYWNNLNLKAAATLAKHRLQEKSPGKFSEHDFYKEITSLSYMGDIRYLLGGENPNKIANIVENNFHNFRDYYKPIYNDVVLNNYSYLPEGYTVENAVSRLESRIAKFSAIQTVKGIFSAGIAKSIKYAWAKKLKAMRSK